MAADATEAVAGAQPQGGRLAAAAPGCVARARAAQGAALAGLLMLALLAGCASTERGASPIPISGSYRVKAGDTLYSIGWRYGLDYRGLARANGLQPPYTIYPGQELRLAEQAAAPAQTPAAASRPTPRAAPKPASERTPGTVPETASTKTPATPSRKLPKPAAAPGAWQWPTSSPVTREFGGASKGLDFAIAAGTPVRAAAAGEVVYAGAGLGGFQHLVILKHDERHLSAYGLNQPIAVREGQQVGAQERIANVRAGGIAARTLHFEIRRDGKPVSPRILLRKR